MNECEPRLIMRNKMIGTDLKYLDSLVLVIIALLSTDPNKGICTQGPKTSPVTMQSDGQWLIRSALRESSLILSYIE